MTISLATQFKPQTYYLGIQQYTDVWEKMRTYTINRTMDSHNQIWFLQHPSVFTLGHSKNHQNLVNKTSIPLIKTDRGGDITYHGLGQLIIYLMFDLRRDNIGIKRFVNLIEQSVINCLDFIGLPAHRKTGYPGIYTNEGKIAALGLNCKKRGTYHGLSINVNMDLTPFQCINPCGIEQPVTQIKAYRPDVTLKQVENQWLNEFLALIN